MQAIEAIVKENDIQPWTPDVTVATVVARDGRLLLVEERVAGELVLNQPAGHLEPGESLPDAARRETLEETGWEVAPTAFLGSYLWRSPRDGRSFLRFAFVAEAIRHHADRRLDAGIERIAWLSPAALAAEVARHRSPLVWRVAEDFLGGRRLPLSAVDHLP